MIITWRCRRCLVRLAFVTNSISHRCFKETSILLPPSDMNNELVAIYFNVNKDGFIITCFNQSELGALILRYYDKTSAELISLYKLISFNRTSFRLSKLSLLSAASLSTITNLFSPSNLSFSIPYASLFLTKILSLLNFLLPYFHDSHSCSPCPFLSLHNFQTHSLAQHLSLNTTLFNH